MIFHLGTHQPDWLAKVDVPLFVSHRRLRRYKRLPRARGRWACDSSGFTELLMYGRWTVSPADYAAAVLRYADEIGMLEWAASQDWMCEPQVLAKTGLTVAEHQRRSVDSYLDLCSRAPLPWVPVVQGWTLPEYLEHIAMYEDSGVGLRALHRVGVGSICRRQHTDEAEAIIRAVAAHGIRVHCFGLKIRGAARVANVIASADSMAWSLDARRTDPLPGCTTHKNCANCLIYAMRWRDKVIASTGGLHA